MEPPTTWTLSDIGRPPSVAEQLAAYDRWWKQKTKPLERAGYTPPEAAIIANGEENGDPHDIIRARLARVGHYKPLTLPDDDTGDEQPGDVEPLAVSPDRGPPTAAESRLLSAGFSATIATVVAEATALSREQADLISAITAGGER